MSEEEYLKRQKDLFKGNAPSNYYAGTDPVTEMIMMSRSTPIINSYGRAIITTVVFKKHRLPRKLKKQLVKQFYFYRYGKKLLKKQHLRALRAEFVKNISALKQDRITLVTSSPSQHIQAFGRTSRTSGSNASIVILGGTKEIEAFLNSQKSEK